MTDPSVATYRLSHEITAEGATDMYRLIRRGYIRVGVGSGALITAVGGVAVFSGWVELGLVAMAAGLITVWAAALPTFDRWMIGRQMRGVIGGHASSVIDQSGIHFENPQLSGEIKWSGLTHILANDRVVVLMRDRVPVAWIPTLAFSGIQQRGEIVSFMRDQIAAAHAAPPRT